MRIVNREAFLRLPPNTLFSKYAPCVFDALMVRKEADLTNNDFYYQDIASSLDAASSHDMFDTLDRAKKTGESIKMDLDCTSRDGCYDNGQLFAVWEEAEIRDLIGLLQQCLPKPK